MSGFIEPLFEQNASNTVDFSAALASALREEDPEGTRLGRTIRETFDQIYDGQNTGRYCVSQLSKTEAAHIGSLIEINIRRAFDGFITDGEMMDFLILGVEADCKYSKMPFGWMIPSETLGHYAMVCHANDETSTFRIGFVKITGDILNAGGNRDGKRTISKIGRKKISWAFFDHPLPPNTLLALADEVRESILSKPSGQQRLDELFRQAQGVIIPRGIIATVAQQKDYMKRLRYNGGSRSNLQPEGIVILGDYTNHRQIARELGLPIPQAGDSIAVRLRPGSGTKSTTIAGTNWVVAGHEDPIVPAPLLSIRR